MRFTNADAGSLYLVLDHIELKFEIVINKSKGLHIGGKSSQAIDPVINSQTAETSNVIDTKSIPLYLPNGQPNLTKVVCNAVHLAKTINIPEMFAYHIEFTTNDELMFVTTWESKLYTFDGKTFEQLGC